VAIISAISLNRSSLPLTSPRPSSTLPSTDLSSFNRGSCSRMPTVAPGARYASPLFGWSIPAMILSTLDLPAPLGPTTPIFAPGRNARVTPSRMTLSPCALRTCFMV